MLRTKQFPRVSIAAAVLAAVTACVIFAGPSQLKPSGYPQLVATQPLPEMSGEICLEMASLQEPKAPLRTTSANANRAPTSDADRSPLRIIHDTVNDYSMILASDPDDELTGEMLDSVLNDKMNLLRDFSDL